jgi:spermidine/putrescine transport system substrate-binding protein
MTSPVVAVFTPGRTSLIFSKEDSMKRVLVLATVLVVLAFALVSCGGAEQEEGQLAAELHIYNWSDYIDEEIYAEFEEEFGVRVVEDTFASNEELLAKLQAGATGYDIIIPSDYMVDIMIQEGMLSELNKENIPNIANLDPVFTDPPFDPGMKYCLPYQWGTTGIGYNTEFFDEPPDSWSYIFDPEMAAQFDGKISMLNDSREAMGAALKYLGHSLNSTNPAELEEARDLLISIKPYLFAYDSEQFGDLMSANETVIGHGWSGEYFLAAYEDERIWYTIPKEGGVIWVDNMCIPETAPNKYTAEVFMNYLLRPEVGAKITNYTWYGSPNKASEEFIIEDILFEPAIYPPPEVMAKLEWLVDVGEATPLYEQMWTEVKAAGQ